MQKLSVITVVYNGEINLEQTIKSVLYQKNENIEYIIVDGCSIDQTLMIIEKYKSAIDIFISEPDLGIYDAMNKGIRLSSGDYISFLNAGDTLLDDFSQKVFSNLDDRFDIISFGILYKFLDGKIAVKLPEKIIESSFNPQHMYLPHPGILAKRATFLNNGLFDIAYKCSADLDWVNRIVSKPNSSIKYVDSPIVVFIAGGISLSIQSFKESKKIAIKYGKSALIANYIHLKQILRFYFHLN